MNTMKAAQTVLWFATGIRQGRPHCKSGRAELFFQLCLERHRCRGPAMAWKAMDFADLVF